MFNLLEGTPTHPPSVISDILPVNQISEQSLPGFTTTGATVKSVPLQHTLYKWVVFLFPHRVPVLMLACHRAMLMRGCHRDPCRLLFCSHLLSPRLLCVSATLRDGLDTCLLCLCVFVCVCVCVCVCSLLLPFTFGAI